MRTIDNVGKSLYVFAAYAGRAPYFCIGERSLIVIIIFIASRRVVMCSVNESRYNHNSFVCVRFHVILSLSFSRLFRKLKLIVCLMKLLYVSWQYLPFARTLACTHIFDLISSARYTWANECWKNLLISHFSFYPFWLHLILQTSVCLAYYFLRCCSLVLLFRFLVNLMALFWRSRAFFALSHWTEHCTANNKRNRRSFSQLTRLNMTRYFWKRCWLEWHLSVQVQ